MGKEGGAEEAVRESRWRIRWKVSAEDNIRIVFEGLRGEECIAERIAGCNREVRGDEIRGQTDALGDRISGARSLFPRSHLIALRGAAGPSLSSAAEERVDVLHALCSNVVGRD